jgi:hypothetical protein
MIMPPMSAASFSAGSDGTDETASAAITNSLSETASMLLAHLSGDGAIEWLWAPNVAPGATTPYFTVNFADANHDYWICTAWVDGDGNSPYCALSSGELLWKKCGIDDSEAGSQITLNFTPTKVYYPVASACSADVSTLYAQYQTCNLQIVNNVAGNVSMFLFFVDFNAMTMTAYCQNGMTLGQSSPLFQAGFLGLDSWLLQAVDVENQVAYVTGGTSFSQINLHDSDANQTVVLSVDSTQVTMNKPSGQETLALTSQPVIAIQTVG